MEVINAGMRKGIKVMAVVCQTAQFVSLMPKPKDFVTRIVGDVVYLSAQLTKLSEDMNKLLDSYADIPVNYFMTQVNSITGSLSGITNRLNTYTQNGVNQIAGLGENALNTISEITGSAIDTTGSITSAIVSLGSAVSQTSVNILGQTDTSGEINDATEVILEWTNNGFKTVKDDVTKPINDVTNKLNNIKSGVTDTINGATNTVNNKIQETQKWIQSLINELREKVQKLSNLMDTNFKDVTGLSSVSKGATTISTGLVESGEKTLEVTVTQSITSSLSSVINNFSISKVVFAFAGVIAQSAIVKLGLDQLPPIDFESMMYKIRDDITISENDLYKQYQQLSDSTYNDIIKFGEDLSKAPSEFRNYSAENYDKFKDEFEDELKKQREDIRTRMKFAKNDRSQATIAKKEMRSAIKEIEKYRKQIKNAKQTSTLKSIIDDELKNFKKEIEYRSNSIKSDWESMMKQYRDAIKEIKEFFSTGGSCDMFIDDCCNQINKDCDDIKELCTNLGTQLVCCTIKVVMPADIGPVFPNPGYKIPDFLKDIKTIFKFIKDLITLIIDIINNINKLVRIMLNGLNNLKEILDQFLELIGLKWLMNLVQNIINLFSDNIKSAKLSLENTLTPVYFSDTKEYENSLEALESLLDGKRISGISGIIEKSTDILKLNNFGDFYKVTTDKDYVDAVSNVNNISYINVNSDSDYTKKQSEKVQKLIDELEKRGDEIVAYKSPIIKEPGNTSKVSDMIDGNSSTADIKFIGWHFFHPNLNHTNSRYYKNTFFGTLIKKIKSNIIKKAAKTGNKKRGGVNGLKSRWKVKTDFAYTAFYWYTYYTEDLEKDCFEFGLSDESIIIDNVVQTENGSVVQLSDGRKVFVANNMVKSGDYVNVDGVKYRVGK